MSAAHTPGPWLRDKYGHVVDSEGRDVHFRSVAIACAGHRVAQAEANTTLIAAAPQLLGALKAVLHYLNDRSDVDVRDGDQVPNAENVMLVELGDGIRAAIAKATGGQS